jgi:hypothetical protein
MSNARPINRDTIMDMLERAFTFLTDIGACRTQTEFSREWLGGSDHYFAYLRCAEAQPSLSTISHLGQQMVEIGSSMRSLHGRTRETDGQARAMFDLGLEMALCVVKEGWERQRRRRALAKACRSE